MYGWICSTHKFDRRVHIGVPREAFATTLRQLFWTTSSCLYDEVLIEHQIGAAYVNVSLILHVETLAGNCLGIWKFFPSNHSIYFPFCYSWLKTENNLNLTLRFLASTQDTPIISHYPSSNLTTFQKGSYYFGIKVFNSRPPSIKNLVHDTKQFRSALKRFLLLNSFYSLEEYFNYNKN